MIKCVLYASSTILAARERGRGGGLVPPTRNFVAKPGMGTWRDAVLIDGGTRLANRSNHRNEAGARKKKTHLRSLAVEGPSPRTVNPTAPRRRRKRRSAPKPAAGSSGGRRIDSCGGWCPCAWPRAPCPCVGGGWLCGAAAAVWSRVGFRVSISLDPGFLEWALAQ